MHAWVNQDQNILVFTCKPPPPVEPPVWPAGQNLETEEKTEELLNQPCTSRSPLTSPPCDCNQARPLSSPHAIQLERLLPFPSRSPLTTPPPPPPAIQLPLRRATHYHPYRSSPSPLPTQYRIPLSSHNPASSSSHSIGSSIRCSRPLQDSPETSIQYHSNPS